MTHPNNQNEELKVVNSYVHVHEPCQKCGGCIYECKHRIKARLTTTDGDAKYLAPHPKPTQAEDGDLDAILEALRPFSIHKSKYVSGRGTLARKQLTNRLRRLKSTWQAEARREMLGKLPEKRVLENIEQSPLDQLGMTLEAAEGFNKAVDLIRERLESK